MTLSTPNHSNQPPVKLLVFAGSARAGSLNRKLAHQAACMARATGAETTLLELADFDIPIYNADIEAQGTPADVILFKQMLFDHAGWIICSPEYNGSITGLLKNAIDWASSPVKGDLVWADGTRPFAGKVAGLLSASPGALGGLRSLMQLQPLLMNLQCWVTPRQFALGQAPAAFDAEGKLISDKHRASVQAVIDQVLFAAQRLSVPIVPAA